MTRTYSYTKSEAGNIIVAKSQGLLLIKIGKKTYVTYDPENPPPGKEVKAVEVEESATIQQIFKAIEK